MIVHVNPSKEQNQPSYQTVKIIQLSDLQALI